MELVEAILYADDGASEIVKEFKSDTLSLGVDDLGTAAAATLQHGTRHSIETVLAPKDQAKDT